MDDFGIVLAATGKQEYIELAYSLAKRIKAIEPDISIDLYCDRHRDPFPFDRLHVVEDPWKRTKIDTLLHSRFDRTLYLDVDIIPVAPIRDIFPILEHFDLVIAHDQFRNRSFSRINYKMNLPPSFPQLNSGVLGVRKSPLVTDFIQKWRDAVVDHGIGRDQPSFRELIWESQLRFYVLPPEFNLMDYSLLDNWKSYQPAPRLIHAPVLHHDFHRFDSAKDRVTELLGIRRASRLQYLLEQDRSLAEMFGRELRELKISDCSTESFAELLKFAAPRIPARLASVFSRKILRPLRLTSPRR